MKREEEHVNGLWQKPKRLIKRKDTISRETSVAVQNVNKYNELREEVKECIPVCHGEQSIFVGTREEMNKGSETGNGT